MLATCAGILVVDLIAAHLPKVSDPGELVFAPKGIEMHMGGHAGNVSVDLRKLGLEEGEASSIGAVGQDVLGDFLERLLRSHGVIPHLQRTSEAGTSKDLVLVVKGEDRRFHVDLGANWFLSPKYIVSVLEEEMPLLFYAGGVGFTGMVDAKLPDLLQKAKALGCLTFVDPVQPYEQGWGFIPPAMPWTDIFHCNSYEAEKITGKSSPEDAAKALTKRGAPLVIISLGAEGLIAETKNHLFKMSPFKVPVVDPTGAGDALCAGTIRALLRTVTQKRCSLSDLSEDEIAQILLEGEAAGAACVTAVGTTTAVTEENVNKILKEQGTTILKQHLKISPV